MPTSRRALPFLLIFLAFLLCFAAISGMLSLLAGYYASSARADLPSDPSISLTVILDAGHGGEDGGAVSASGLLEKDLNLDITMRLAALLEAEGVRVILTRDTDTLLYDRNVDYRGRKKALDLAARRRVAEENPNAIFVSIHMNAYPQAQTRGLQVWYSQNDARSCALAEMIQSTVSAQLQPENDRRIKPATSAIYLLHRIQSPAVLVECGFLSCPEEAAALGNEEYRERLAFLIRLAILKYAKEQAEQPSELPSVR